MWQSFDPLPMGQARISWALKARMTSPKGTKGPKDPLLPLRK